MFEAIGRADVGLFYWLHSLSGWPVLDTAMVLMARWMPAVTLLTLSVLWFWPGKERDESRITVILTVLAILVALGANAGPGLFHYRPRPYLEYVVEPLLSANPTNAFPSEHSAGSAAFSSALSMQSRQLGLVAWALTWGTMLGRVYSGVHYPLDVFVGACVGWAAGALVRTCRTELRPFAQRLMGLDSAERPSAR